MLPIIGSHDATDDGMNKNQTLLVVGAKYSFLTQSANNTSYDT